MNSVFAVRDLIGKAADMVDRIRGKHPLRQQKQPRQQDPALIGKHGDRTRHDHADNKRLQGTAPSTEAAAAENTESLRWNKVASTKGATLATTDAPSGRLYAEGKNQGSRGRDGSGGRNNDTDHGRAHHGMSKRALIDSQRDRTHSNASRGSLDEAGSVSKMRFHSQERIEDHGRGNSGRRDNDTDHGRPHRHEMSKRALIDVHRGRTHSNASRGWTSGEIRSRQWAGKRLRAAIVLHGKIGSLDRGQGWTRAVDGGAPSLDLVIPCYASMVRHVIEANRATAVVDIFGHSWNPDLSVALDALFTPKRSLHERDEFMRNRKLCATIGNELGRLAGDNSTTYSFTRFGIVGRGANSCERTANHLLGMQRAIALKVKKAAWDEIEAHCALHFHVSARVPCAH